LLFRPASGKEGQFRLVLGGSEHINVRFPAIAILPIPEMEKFEIAGQFKPGTQISIQQNSSCSKWLDLTELVLSNDLDVADNRGEDAHEDFLEAVAAAQTTLESVGLSCRWMVAATKDSTLELLLQALPTRASVLIKTPALNKDTTAATILAR
jgi:hypothetical protein